MTLRPGSPHEIGREDSTLAPVTPDPGSELQRQIGDFLLHTPRTDTPPLPQPPSRLFNIARRLGAWLQPDRKPADTSTVTSPLAETLQTAPYTFQLEPTEQLNMAPYLGRAGVDLSEKAASRETWTSLKFESASTEKPYYKIDNKGIVRGNDDRVLDDSEHGIWGVFDGVGGSEGAAHAAEFVRDFMHTALLTATRPKSLDKAKMLMNKYSPMHVRRAKITV